jgi:type II secretion system protein C
MRSGTRSSGALLSPGPVPWVLALLFAAPPTFGGLAAAITAQAGPDTPARAVAEPTAPSPGPAIEALGLVRSAAAEHSVAILRSEGRTRVIAVGEKAFGARLLAIGADSVELDLAGRPLVLHLTPVPPVSAAARSPRAAALPPDIPPEDPATPAREMERRQVQIRLGEEMNRILSDTALAPVTEDGRVVGVKITRIAEGSLLTDAGLRAGDILTRVNGTTIDGMASLIALWPRLQGASELDAVVLRGGQPYSLRVTLR